MIRFSGQQFFPAVSTLYPVQHHERYNCGGTLVILYRTNRRGYISFFCTYGFSIVHFSSTHLYRWRTVASWGKYIHSMYTVHSCWMYKIADIVHSVFRTAWYTLKPYKPCGRRTADIAFCWYFSISFSWKTFNFFSSFTILFNFYANFCGRVNFCS